MIRYFSLGDFWYIVGAARYTLALAGMAMLGGALIGGVVTVLRVSPIPPLRWLAMGYIGLIQGTPVLGQLFIFYFGLSIFGFRISPWTAAAIAFSLYASAFFSEIWRGSVQAVPPTQWEASAALGFTFAQQLRYVIVPQAVRLSIPPSMGFTVQLIKNTSLASTIGFIELTRSGQIISNATFQPLAVFLAVAAVYFVICFSLATLSTYAERRLHVAR
jgi:polar amino acid transport system permease protein